MPKEPQIVMNNNEKDFEQLAKDAKDLLDATVDVVDVRVKAARDKLVAVLKADYTGVKEKVAACACTTDTAVRAHPYHASLIALGVGVVAGLLISKRCKKE